MPIHDLTTATYSEQTLSRTQDMSQETRKEIGKVAFTKSFPITILAQNYDTSRKFIYEQKARVETAVNSEFSESHDDSDVLFTISVTRRWLMQVVLFLVLTCHSSYEGVIEFFRDILDTKISKGTVFNIMRSVIDMAKNDKATIFL